MAGLLDLLNSDTGKQIIDGISQKAGVSSAETSSVLTSALPQLAGALQSNAATPEGASGLLGALTGGKHDGSILDNLSGFLGSGDATAEGGSILGHIFGNNQDATQNAISAKTGVSSDKVSAILKMAAPIIMGYLGKQTKANNVGSAGGLSDMLSGLLGGSSGGGLTSVLDQNGDGKLDMSDATAALSGKKGGIGGFLSSLFGK